MDGLAEWLLDGPAWVQYRTRLDLLGQPISAPEVVAARDATLVDAQVKALLHELVAWPGPPLGSHKDAGHLLHKLAFVADLGLRMADPGIADIAERILDRCSQEGAFQIAVNVPQRYGGTGQDQLAWMLCDAPLVLSALVSFGLEDDPRVQRAARHLSGSIRENGWPCAVALDLGKFRGPGRKADPCPYATLLALRALSQMREWRESDACRIGAETLLGLWDHRKERRPYLFAMGSDFAKLKAPLIWYDILHVTDVLTRFPWLREDHRLREMLDIVWGKADAQGRFAPQSVWNAWKGWEFGQKRTPSRWVTLIAQRALRQAIIPLT